MTIKTSNIPIPAIYIIVLLAVIYAAIVALMLSRTDTTMRQELLQQTGLLSTVIDARDIGKLQGDETDYSSSVFLKLKQHLSDAREIHQHCEFIYLMGWSSPTFVCT